MRESPQHLHQKQRIRDLARSRGYIAENEVPFVCWSGFHDKPICYYADIFMLNRKGEASIIEIDGYRGHSSRYQSARDERRTADIKNIWGDDIRIRRYTIKELEILTDEEIEEEIGIG